MKMLCVAAIVGMMSVAEAGEWDANLSDFPRLAGETDDAPRFMRAVAAAPNGVLRVPKGEYDIASMIYITNRCSLSMHSAAHLVARAKMKYVLFWDGAADYHALSVFNPDGSVYDNANLFIKGGDIDGNGLASCLVQLVLWGQGGTWSGTQRLCTVAWRGARPGQRSRSLYDFLEPKKIV